MHRSRFSSLLILSLLLLLVISHLPTAVLANGPTQFYGPLSYSSLADSPFGVVQHLENFEDHLFNQPGVTVNGGGVNSVIYGPAGHDSVDADDGSIDGSGLGGDSYFTWDGPTGLTFSFDAAAWEELPTEVGIVWTDGGGDTAFEAFDAAGASLGIVGPVALADGAYNGTTAEDHFFGISNLNGISAIKISNSNGGMEVDHFQYNGLGSPRAPSATFYGPIPYLQLSDSPFEGVNSSYNKLEDFEDLQLDSGISYLSGGVTSVIYGPEGHDSVDADDGEIDGSGLGGESFINLSGSEGITFLFDDTTLHGLPTRVGIVWTDGGGVVTFEAFDPTGVSLGTATPVVLGDASFNGTTAEDRFFGVWSPDGISKIKISNSVGGIEVDHLQYMKGGALNITDSPNGQQYASEAADRWHTIYGVVVPSNALTVYNLSTPEDPDLLILPPSISIEGSLAPWFGAQKIGTEVGIHFLTSNMPVSTENPAHQDCLERRLEDPLQARSLIQCYKIYKVYETQDRDYYVLEHTASIHRSSEAADLSEATIASSFDKGSLSPQDIQRNSLPVPATAVPGNNCTQSQSLYLEVGVTTPAGGVTIGLPGETKQVCEIWDIEFQMLGPGNFRNTWTGPMPEGTGNNREIAYRDPVSVPHNTQVVGWYLFGGLEW